VLDWRKARWRVKLTSDSASEWSGTRSFEAVGILGPPLKYMTALLSRAPALAQPRSSGFFVHHAAAQRSA
jgi:hypothetical protein